MRVDEQARRVVPAARPTLDQGPFFTEPSHAGGTRACSLRCNRVARMLIIGIFASYWLKFGAELPQARPFHTNLSADGLAELRSVGAFAISLAIKRTNCTHKLLKTRVARRRTEERCNPPSFASPFHLQYSVHSKTKSSLGIL